MIKIKVFTSYFGNLKTLPSGIVPITICGKAPQSWNGLQYKKLAPKYSFFSEWKKTGDNNYYVEHFNEEVLDTLDADEVYTELSKLSGGSDVALVCYEIPSDFCHRHLVATWLSTQLGIEVAEFNKDTNAKNPFRIIVAGGRDFADYEMLSSHLDKLLTFISMKKRVQVVCGGARGADSLGERYAKERGYDIAYFPADWDKYGKAAGFKRNTQMAENADALVAFWDGSSPGTKHMIETAKSKGLAVRIKHY